MTSFRILTATAVEILLIVFGVSTVLIPVSPMNMPSTYRDSGVFLYIGWRIVSGELPYRDVWDHKPPIVFYLNALGLSLSHNSRWGVWWVEFFALTFAALAGYALMKKMWGMIPSLLSSILWLITLVFLIQGGNLTTEYTLPLQFAALWLACDINNPKLSSWHYLIIGALGSIAFFTKQTSIGIWLSIVCYLTLRRFMDREGKRWSRELFLISMGSLAITFCIAVFFGVQNALPQFWSATMSYSLVYSSAIHGMTDRVQPLVAGIAPLTSTGLFQLAMVGYGFAILVILSRKRMIEDQIPLLAIGLIAFPIELVMIGASGLAYFHYYMTILPILSLFAGLVFWVCNSCISAWHSSSKYVFLITVTGVLVWQSWAHYRNQVIEFSQVKDQTVVNYIKGHSAPDDYVLLWGADSASNFFAQRKSPTRFVYQYPLYAVGYANEQMIMEFLDTIIQKCPPLIIDTKNPLTPIYNFPIHTNNIASRVAYLRSHYHAVAYLGSWSVYQYNGSCLEDTR